MLLKTLIQLITSFVPFRYSIQDRTFRSQSREPLNPLTAKCHIAMSDLVLPGKVTTPRDNRLINWITRENNNNFLQALKSTLHLIFIQGQITTQVNSPHVLLLQVLGHLEQMRVHCVEQDDMSIFNMECMQKALQLSQSNSSDNIRVSTN